jgi:hypothetical protein
MDTNEYAEKVHKTMGYAFVVLNIFGHTGFSVTNKFQT